MTRRDFGTYHGVRSLYLSTPKYFGVHGILEGYAPGLYIIETSDYNSARKKLTQHVRETSRNWYMVTELQEIKGEWAEVLSDTLDQIRNREKEYYIDLGNEVFYVEV